MASGTPNSAKASGVTPPARRPGGARGREGCRPLAAGACLGRRGQQLAGSELLLRRAEVVLAEDGVLHADGETSIAEGEDGVVGPGVLRPMHLAGLEPDRERG